METTLVCDVCQQAWDASEGDDCILCGRKGRVVEEVLFDAPTDFKLKRTHKYIRSDYIRLSVKKAYIIPLLLILREEIARVTSITERERTDNDKDMLMCVEDLLQRLKRTLEKNKHS